LRVILGIKSNLFLEKPLNFAKIGEKGEFGKIKKFSIPPNSIKLEI